MNARHTQLALPDLARLSDDQLVRSLEQLVRQSRSTTAAILAHLIEVERRELHLAAACSSLFTYCTEVPAARRHLGATGRGPLPVRAAERGWDGPR